MGRGNASVNVILAGPKGGYVSFSSHKILSLLKGSLEGRGPLTKTIHLDGA